MCSIGGGGGSNRSFEAAPRQILSKEKLIKEDESKPVVQPSFQSNDPRMQKAAQTDKLFRAATASAGFGTGLSIGGILKDASKGK